MDFTCAACRRIPAMDDFRHRVARRGESGDAHHAKTNIRYRASTELAQSQAQELRSLKKQQFFLVSKLAASQASRMSWKARCRNAAGRGDVRRVTDELTKAYEDGKFEGKTALWNFLSDLVHCAASEPDKNGRRATIKYHGSTHRFFLPCCANLVVPGPRGLSQQTSGGQRVAPGSATAAPNVANGGRPSDAGFVVGAGGGGGASSKPKKKGREGGKR